MYRLHLGDCLEVMPTMPADSFHSIVTDPPYGLAFMGKHWDHGIPGVQFWKEALRVARPGAHLLCFGGDRTHHRLMVAIEDAGWQIRTCLYWIFGQGFPKSRDIGNAIRSEFSEDSLCVCVRHSKRTVQDSQVGYSEYYRRDDGSLLRGSDTAPNAIPLRSDVPERSHVDPREDDPGATKANISLDEETARRSIDYSYSPTSRPSGESQDADSAQFDTRENKSNAPATESHKTDSRKLHKHDSVFDSASSLIPPDIESHPYSPYCTSCGKLIASRWDGWGTGLKPAAEIIIMAMKPMPGTFAQNAINFGVAGINIDASRIPGDDMNTLARNNKPGGNGWKNSSGGPNSAALHGDPLGRWPANVLFDEEAAAVLDSQKEGAARFFKNVASEPVCYLCGLPINEGHGIMTGKGDHLLWSKSAKNAETNSAQRITEAINDSATTNVQREQPQRSGGKPEPSNENANNAGNRIGDTQANASGFVPTNAELDRFGKIAQNVPIAENLCDLCGTSIVLSIAVMQLGRSPESIVGQVFIPAHKKQTLMQCLVSFAGALGSTDTIPTTENLILWFGYVRDAMRNSIPTEGTADVQAQTSRLFYRSKASKADRDDGLDEYEDQLAKSKFNLNNGSGDLRFDGAPTPTRKNIHPTVKPTELMRYLCAMVTPEGGRILDPFMGSGSTGRGAMLGGFLFEGIEREAEYIEIAKRRIAAIKPQAIQGRFIK